MKRYDETQTLFLFGAGASHGSGACAPYPPPLGGSLFSELKRFGGIVATFDRRLQIKFENNFEEGMDVLWQTRSEDCLQFLREMSVYFLQFSVGKGNCYTELMRFLSSSPSQSVIATTNYDLLIERAATVNNRIVSYGIPTTEADAVPILKIHGSCNFLPDLGGGSIRGVRLGSSGIPGGAILEAPVKVAFDPWEVFNFCYSGTSLSPAIAMYSPTKQVLVCQKFVQNQLAEFQRLLGVVADVFVVGLRVHEVDEHIWGKLKESTSHVHYVGREPEAFLAWSNGRVGKSSVLAESFSAALAPIEAHLLSTAD